jgi:serine/threonine protein kinase
VSVCVWCGFDRLQEEADLCSVCGQTPDSNSVTLVRVASNSPVDHSSTPEPMSSFETAERIFAGRYTIEAAVGSGGMGSVFRVRDRSDGAVRALKVLHAQATQSRSTLRRFEREAEVLRRIDHQAIPHIHDFGVTGEMMYLVTDFIEGTSLRDLMRRNNRFSTAEVTRIGAAIADCLNAAHEHGVIHRDIKPHNVMISPDGDIHLIDFGIARDKGVNASTITATGFIPGTPRYMSPEQFDGRQVDGRTDIYSLGVVLFEMATGRPPFLADTPAGFGMRHMTEPPPPPHSIRSEIPMLLSRVILRCLEKNPSARYATAADLATDLRRAADSRRRVHRTRIGDFVISENSTEEWALVLASSEEKSHWPIGMTLLYAGSHYRLERVDYDTTFPGPYVYRFAFFPEAEVIRLFVDYDQTPEPEPRSRLSRWFRGTKAP